MNEKNTEIVLETETFIQEDTEVILSNQENVLEDTKSSSGADDTEVVTEFDSESDTETDTESDAETDTELDMELEAELEKLIEFADEEDTSAASETFEIVTQTVEFDTASIVDELKYIRFELLIIIFLLLFMWLIQSIRNGMRNLNKWTK